MLLLQKIKTVIASNDENDFQLERNKNRYVFARKGKVKFIGARIKNNETL